MRALHHITEEWIHHPTHLPNDPDWYYDHYEYGDNPDVDDYLESEGYD